MGEGISEAPFLWAFPDLPFAFVDGWLDQIFRVRQLAEHGTAVSTFGRERLGGWWQSMSAVNHCVDQSSLVLTVNVTLKMKEKANVGRLPIYLCLQFVGVLCDNHAEKRNWSFTLRFHGKRQTRMGIVQYTRKISSRIYAFHNNQSINNVASV